MIAPQTLSLGMGDLSFQCFFIINAGYIANYTTKEVISNVSELSSKKKDTLAINKKDNN